MDSPPQDITAHMMQRENGVTDSLNICEPFVISATDTAAADNRGLMPKRRRTMLITLATMENNIMKPPIIVILSMEEDILWLKREPIDIGLLSLKVLSALKADNKRQLCF